MQLTVEIDDETYAGIEAVAKREHASVGSVAARALGNFRKMVHRQQPVKAAHGYQMPISPSRPFTMEDVYQAEDENDMRGLE